MYPVAPRKTSFFFGGVVNMGNNLFGAKKQVTNVKEYAYKQEHVKGFIKISPIKKKKKKK